MLKSIEHNANIFFLTHYQHEDIRTKGIESKFIPDKAKVNPMFLNGLFNTTKAIKIQKTTAIKSAEEK